MFLNVDSSDYGREETRVVRDLFLQKEFRILAIRKDSSQHSAKSVIILTTAF